MPQGLKQALDCQNSTDIEAWMLKQVQHDGGGLLAPCG
jgi:hypothetical protein